MMDDKPDYFMMLFQIKFISNYADSYLLSLNEEELEQLWLEKVNHG